MAGVTCASRFERLREYDPGEWVDNWDNASSVDGGLSIKG
jgi:hypothetical protein